MSSNRLMFLYNILVRKLLTFETGYVLRKFVAMRLFAQRVVLLLLQREKRVQQILSTVAGDAGEQTLISISTDAVESLRSVITLSESMASSKERLQMHLIIRYFCLITRPYASAIASCRPVSVHLSHSCIISKWLKIPSKLFSQPGGP